jgi:hypothetical protein
LSNPLYPNVPALPGVPPVFRGPLNPANRAATGPPALTQDAKAIAATPAAWGLYTPRGALALAVDSIFSLEPNREYRLSDYPVEQGGFAHYNKVATPGELRVVVTKGGSDADRAAFLSALDVIVASIDLINVVTPDTAFTDINIFRYDYRRNAQNGVTLLTVELQMLEIRQSVQTKYSDSKAPSGADLKNDGPVQPTTPAVTQVPAPGVTIV